MLERGAGVSLHSAVCVSAVTTFSTLLALHRPTRVLRKHNGSTRAGLLVLAPSRVLREREVKLNTTLLKAEEEEPADEKHHRAQHTS